jgi:tagaturonate epimerase
MKIGKYSFGTGDRFGLQGEAQLKAIIKANDAGIPLIPVWNKSNREHKTIRTEPFSVRKEADQAVKSLAWDKEYYVDADHINLETVDSFLHCSDFFTIDVADFIGKAADQQDVIKFIEFNKRFIPQLKIDGINKVFLISSETLEAIAEKYLFAIKKAGEIYRYISKKKGEDGFIPEVSMDEVDQPQTPLELFFILSGLAMEKVPVQTIAPKFSGRFNKGVDYTGDVKLFEKEFEEDLLVLEKAIKEFKLPENLKLSVHSGSDKFSIYPIIGKLIKKYDKGIHVKTAGTTWLEEMIGLALSGGEALKMAKKVYSQAYNRKEELAGPYASVIDIDDSKLPLPSEVNSWTGEQYANALRHIPENPEYNMHFRQLIHVGYKIAAEFSDDFLNLLKTNKVIVEQQVIENIYKRHIKRLFSL